MLRASGAEPHQRRSCDAEMSVQDLFDWDGEQGTRPRHDTLAFATAHPEPALLVERADVPHPMHDSSVLANLGEASRLRSRIILLRDHRTAHGDLAYLPVGDHEVIRPSLDRLIGDSN